MLRQYVSQNPTCYCAACYCAALTQSQLYQYCRAVHYAKTPFALGSQTFTPSSSFLLMAALLPYRGEVRQPQKAVGVLANTCHMSTMGQDAPEAPAGHPFQQLPQQKHPQTAWRCALCFPVSSRLQAHSQASTPAHGDLCLIAL